MKLRRDDGKTAEVEIEGDKWTWWYVCGECHSAVNLRDEKCRECGRRLIWDDRH